MAQPEGLLLTPGAGGSADHRTLVAIAETVTSVPVIRHDFAYRRAGKKAPPRAPKLVAEFIEELPELAASVGADPANMVVGGRSMGGRVCSLAVGEGLEVAGLVLLSYPLHPVGKPDKLRVDHFEKLEVPCLFISGDRDPFGTPAEFDKHLAKIPGPVKMVWIEGGRHDPNNKPHIPFISQTVRDWLQTLR
jgi:uncharacterized protein